MIYSIKDFLKLESSGGIFLMFAMGLAMIAANSPLDRYYYALLNIPIELRIGPLQIAKPFLLWINDGLMAIFFFLVGLELKREVLEGELSDLKTITLPALAAIGGMIVPAVIYAWLNWGDKIALSGWAIPAATDIAFALGVLALLGNRVPIALKVFLVSVAIFDDIGAIIIIAVFYTSELSFLSLFIAFICITLLTILNRKNITEFTPYLLLGIILWIAVLKSGVHATLAGVILAIFIPLKNKKIPEESPLKELEHDLHTAVAFGILPLFAFANSGISLKGIDMSNMLHPVPLGIAAGLFFGKQIGVFLFSWIGVKLRVAHLPSKVGWASLYGISLLCGIGFTMSLFIATLAFNDPSVNYEFDPRIGIIIGSLISAVSGYVILNRLLGRKDK